MCVCVCVNEQQRVCLQSEGRSEAASAFACGTLRGRGNVAETHGAGEDDPGGQSHRLSSRPEGG